MCYIKSRSTFILNLDILKLRVGLGLSKCFKSFSFPMTIPARLFLLEMIDHVALLYSQHETIFDDKFCSLSLLPVSAFNL